MGAEPALISRLTDPCACDPAFAGGKGAALAALVHAGLPVPDGFVVSTTAYQRFVIENGLSPLVAQVTSRPDTDPAGIDAASATLRRGFEDAPIAAPLRAALVAAYDELGEGPVAVRSSATAEDLPEASFAGQQESVLNVVGASDLCVAVQRCWSSLWTARARAYRRHQGIDEEHLALAVVVQKMVAADAAGVLFTADPVSGRRDHTVIEATAGLGEALVGGRHAAAVDARLPHRYGSHRPGTVGIGGRACTADS